MTWFANCFIGLCLCGALCSTAAAQQIRILHTSAVNLTGGWHAQYETHVDPDNSDNMMLCGFRFDPKDDALYGFVYFSSDRGQTWSLALEPRNSSFESEESCAYGVHGVAYYVTSASRVIEGEPHHELGTTRIYVSHNAGKTWKLGTKTGWNDWTTAVVDTKSGANQNRLYAYFNGGLFNRSLNRIEAAEADRRRSNKTGSWVTMVSYKDGDSEVAGPFFTEAEAQESYIGGGSFPSPALVLRDGSILVLYTTKRRSEKDVSEIVVEAAQTSSDRTGLRAPVKVVSSLDHSGSDSDVACGGYFLDPAATYDALQNKVYFAYSDVKDKKCRLFLTSSTDDGSSWSKPQQVRISIADGEQEFDDPAIAVNKDGILALMWEKTDRSGCWMFAASADDGKSFSRATPLGTCSANAIKPSQLNTAYLWDSFFQADPKNPNDSARINLRNTRNNIFGRNQDAIAVTSDGVFHPVWSDAGGGDGELRTAAIHVASAGQLILNATEGLRAVTNRVAILYGGNQGYDAMSQMITLRIVIKNTTDQPLRLPIKIAVPSMNDRGFADIANASNGIRYAGAVWDISSAVPGGTLAPGATTKPFALRFRYLADPQTPRESDDILGLNVRVYAKP